MGDDFIIDEVKDVVYVTTHRENTIEQIALEPGKEKVVVVGDPVNEDVLGPTAGAWGRQPGGRGKVAHFTSDGGLKRPLPDGIGSAGESSQGGVLRSATYQCKAALEFEALELLASSLKFHLFERH